MPQSNYDGQQEYFLNDLDRVINEIKEMSKKETLTPQPCKTK